MPRYTYECTNEQCEKCHFVIEQQRSMDNRNKEDFCECGVPLVRLTDLPSNPQFKGEHTPKFYR